MSSHQLALPIRTLALIKPARCLLGILAFCGLTPVFLRADADVALSKPATQSSTFASNTPASLAVDGNTDGNWNDAPLATTNYDPNAWWQVDLGNSATVNSVVIWNRTDCCGDRLSDYWVFVSNTPFLSTDTPNTLQNRAATWASHQTTAPSPSTTLALPPGGYSGRYVRVQLTNQNYLTLAEVQVNGVFPTSTPNITGGFFQFAGMTASNIPTYLDEMKRLNMDTVVTSALRSKTGMNLARGMAATQSSTLPGSPAASVAVDGMTTPDGNIDGNWADNTVTATNLDNNAWWQVDLGSPATIGNILVWNRTDCCQDRLSDYWVFLSGNPFLPTDTPTTLLARGDTVAFHQTVQPPGGLMTFRTLETVGRYVRVQLSGANYLSLAEVQVFGTYTNNPGSGCYGTDSHGASNYYWAEPGVLGLLSSASSIAGSSEPTDVRVPRARFHSNQSLLRIFPV